MIKKLVKDIEKHSPKNATTDKKNVSSNKPEGRRLLSDLRLSNSSMNTINNCEQKYFHYKVLGTPKDEDCEESTEALDDGSAFHYVQEKTFHLPPKSKAAFQTHLDFAKSKWDLSKERVLKLKAYCLAYWGQVTLKSPLRVVDKGIEILIENELFVGYIDMVLIDAKGYWWIGDLKTAGSLDKGKMAHLHKDQQLNLYANFAGIIAAMLGLDLKKFKGCRYRVTIKSRATYGLKDTDETYVKRVLAGIKSYDFDVPIEMMDPDYFWDEYTKAHDKSLELREYEEPTRNYNKCFDYYKPCEYWSLCHGGELFTDALKRMGLDK